MGSNFSAEFQYISGTPWSSSVEQLLKEYKTTLSGLSHNETLKRLLLYGPNELAKKRRLSHFHLLVSLFFSPLILILLAASAISFFLGDHLDSFIILTMVLMSVGIDFIQRFRSEEATDKLKRNVAVTATILRDGEKKEVLVSRLVPGQIVQLSAGDIIPADCRIVESNFFFVNQSSLTGESLPVEKSSDLIPQDTPLPKRTNMLYFGTTVVAGSATALVVVTGVRTEFGKISKSLTAERPKTDFEKGISKFSYLILKLTFTLVLCVFLSHVFIKQDTFNAFLFAVALAVGLTPEMLPMVIAINLSRGALKMSKAGVIVRELAAIENFGSMDLLCSDKTGTLTVGKIKLEKYENIHGKEDEEVLKSSYINSKFESGLKSPLDEAILAHSTISTRDYKKIDEVPFDFSRKRISVIVKKDNKLQMYTKGSVTDTLSVCSHYIDGMEIKKLNETIKKQIFKRYEQLSKEGFRVLAISLKTIHTKEDYFVSDEKDLAFQGITAFYDPPKPSAKEGLAILTKKGVQLKILTGDNEFVTDRICTELEIAHTENQITTGKLIEKMSDEALDLTVENFIIFAELTPEQKTRVIMSLKRKGHVVGFLGDGINDAASLRAADIGISVNNAVDVAKASADIILLHKSLDILSEGVYEGRKTYANIRKYILMGTSSNFGNMFSVAGASIFLPFLPMLPKQILLNNFLYDLSQLALASDQVDPEYIEKPRKWHIEHIKKFMLIFGPISSLFDFFTFFIMSYIFKASVSLFQTAWFLESVVTQALIIFSIRTSRVPFYESKPKKIFVINVIGIVLFTLISPFIPMVAQAFSLTPPPIGFFVLLGGIIVVYFLISEKIKAWYFAKYDL